MSLFNESYPNLSGVYHSKLNITNQIVYGFAAGAEETATHVTQIPEIVVILMGSQIFSNSMTIYAIKIENYATKTTLCSLTGFPLNAILPDSCRKLK